MEIDRLLAKIPPQTPKDDEEVLLGFVQAIGTNGWFMDAACIGDLMVEALTAAKGAGMRYIALAENNSTTTGDPLRDAWGLVRLLASNHSLRTKLVVFIGTLVEIGDSQGLDWRSRVEEAIVKLKRKERWMH